MKKITQIITVLIVAVFLSGCYTTGLSTRETGSFNYSNFIYGLYDVQSTTQTKPKKVDYPIKIAIAQVGESAPHKAFVQKLEEERHLVARTFALPAGGSDTRGYYNNQNDRDDIQEFEQRMKKMRKIAKDMKADYIFLFGGSADVGEVQNWSGVLDMTLVGAFVVPSHKIIAEGKAAGALIDVETGGVLFMVSSQADLDQKATSYNVYGKRDEALMKLRENLIKGLAEEFVEELKALKKEV